MQWRRRITFEAVTICLIISGCATFEPRLQFEDLKKPRQPSAREIRDGVEVSVEEFATAKKSRMIFDADLASYKILPLLVRIENKGRSIYIVQRKDIKVFLGGELVEALSATEVANRAATSEYVGKALGWTAATGPLFVLLWPATLGVSARHTYGVNQKIRQYFEDTQFPNALLPPNQTTAGFVYVELDEVERLENPVVEIEMFEAESSKGISYKLALPPIDLSR